MPRRIDIELTSRAEGSWTWRAAGARQPRGVVDAALVPEGAEVGSQYRAEVESGVDGIDVLSLLPPKAKTSEIKTQGRIEVLGVPRRAPDVSVQLAGGGRRRDDDRGPKGREGRGGRDSRGGREGRGPREEGGAGRGRADRAERRGPGGRDGRPSRADGPPGRRERRTPVSTAHRNAALAGLRPEQLPVAEQLLRGGLPAVRQAIAEQNQAARSAGKPPAASEAILAMAEELLPAVKLAEWKDKASAAQSAGKDLRLRELREVVAASRAVTLDEEGRTMARTLREALNARQAALREEWLAKTTAAVDGGKVKDALELSASPPEPGVRLPAELAVRLSEAAGAGLTADLDPLVWQNLLDAVVESPVRRTVKPAGIPADESAQAAARNAAGLVPELAKLLGLRVPPPPPRRTSVRRTFTPGGDRGDRARGRAS
jgi:hypothetical protein